MARTPKPPKLKHDGLNFGQKAVIALFFMALLYRFAFTDFTLWDAVKIILGFAIFWIMVTPEWRRFVYSPEKWFKPHEWAQKEPFLSISQFRNRRNLSYGDNLWLEHKVQNLLHICAVTPILLVFGYFAFTPILNLAASYGVPAWGGFIIFIVVCWCVLMLLGTYAIFDRFSDAAHSIVFSKNGYQHGESGGADSPPPMPRRMEDMLKVGKPESEDGDEFAFDPTAFSERSQTAKKPSPEQEREAAEIDRILFGDLPSDDDVKDEAPPATEPEGTNTAPEHHPDDLALWEVVNDPTSTAEERKTALGMILERESERSNRDQ